MPLQYYTLPPVPRGMNLTAPAVVIPDDYCRWMQDVLVDRPGQLRMRGNIDFWGGAPFAQPASGEYGLGACEHYTADNNWRGAVFCATNVTTDGNFPTTSGKVYVYKNESGSKQVVNSTGITLPFTLKTKWDDTNNRWINNSIIDAKPSIKDGVWITIYDDVTNDNTLQALATPAEQNVAALLYWRGAGLPTVELGMAALTSDSTAIVHSTSITNLVEPGMFAFRTSDGSYLGTVASLNTSSNTVYLEKNVLYPAKSGSTSGLTIRYMSFRGFVHQYGRGLATASGGATYLTSGRLGSDAEGLFDAARVTVGATPLAYVYKQSDHKFVGQIASASSGAQVSNTQVQFLAGTVSTAYDLLQDENYFIMRNDANLFQRQTVSDPNEVYDSLKSPMDINYRRPDMRPGTLSLSGSYPYTGAADKVASPHPGIFTASYAGRQWFGSFNSNGKQYDSFINRVVFSGTDNPENVNLCQDASDSITIPGKEPIRGMAGSNSGLLVFVESKTFIIKGTRRENFSLEELYPDGTLCASSIVQVGGGVIWAGKQGIYYYDGVTVRNFTNNTLGIYYTDGIKNYDAGSDRVYAFVYNNYLVINFTKWYSSYKLKRWEVNEILDINTSSGQVFPSSPTSGQLFYRTDEELLYVWNSTTNAWNSLGNFGEDEIIKLTSNGNSCTFEPNRITFCIYLPTGAIGTLSNFNPRGAVSEFVLLNKNGSNDPTSPITTNPPTNNNACLIDVKNIFSENINTFETDKIISTDNGRSTTGAIYYGPDLYIETKQYNFEDFTLNKWWRKLMYTLSLNKGYLMTEFVDNNNNSLVSATTGTSDLYCNADESGFFLIPPTTQKWKFYDQENYEWSQVWDNNSLSNFLKSIQYLQGPQALASAPAGVDGKVYYNTTDSKVYMYFGGSWSSLGTVTGPTSQQLFGTYYSGGTVYAWNGTSWVALTSGNGLYVGVKFLDLTNNDLYSWSGTAWTLIDPNGSDLTWENVFRGAIIRFSRWLGFRHNSLGFRLYSVRNYAPTPGTENLPEIVNINEWNFGLKPLRRGRN